MVLLNHVKRLTQGIILVLLPIGPLMAKEGAKIDVRVEEKNEVRLSATSHAEVIYPEKIPGVAKTVPELLERVAGIQVRRYGGLDDFAQVSIRGSTADQVLVYLDGILLNTSRGGVLDLSLIPLDQVERIEVYRGGAPGKIPDSTPGGVLYFHLRKKPERTKNILSNAAGSFFTYRGNARHSRAVNDFYYHLSLDHFRSRGDFPYRDDRGTRFNTADDRILHRQNNDFQEYNFTASAGKEKKGVLNWKIYDGFFVKHEGIAGLGTRQSLNARHDTLRNVLHVKLKNSPEEAGKLTWEADSFLDYMLSQFSDPFGEIGLGIQNNDDTTLRFGPKFSLSYPFKNHIFHGFLAHRAEFFEPKNSVGGTSYGPLSMRNVISLGLEDEMIFLNDKVILDPSLRLEFLINRLSGEDPSFSAIVSDNRVTDRHLSAKLGIKISPWNFLSFKSNLYRGFRQPTFGELFGDRGTLVGNPALNPEEALNFDFGLLFQRNNLRGVDFLSFESTFYRHQTKNLIQFLQNSQFTAKAQNLNDALILGSELGASIRMTGGPGFSSHYVYQSAKDHGGNLSTRGKFLPGRPRHQFFLEGEYPFRSLRPFFDLQFLSHNFLDSQNLLRVDHRTLAALGCDFRLSKKVLLSLTAKNLLNDTVVDIAGFPLPGRSYWGELKVDL